MTDLNLPTDAHVAIFLGSIAEPGDVALGRALHEYRPTLEGVREFAADLLNGRLRADPPEQREAVALLERVAPRIPKQADLDRQVERLLASDISFVLPWHAEWPGYGQLGRLGDAQPRVLFARGNVTLLKRDSTAIVGARASTGYGEHVANTLTHDLTERGRVIVSGAAYGIDGIAHRAALANGGETVAVLAGGVDRFYPAGHDELLHRIAEHGLVVSEMPPGSAPTKWRFLQRNRVIAALAEQVLVVEAGIRSGSLNTAGHAVASGVPVFAVPGPITSPASAGCHRLLSDGLARIATSADDILSPNLWRPIGVAAD